MSRVKTILFNITFAANCLLLFLLVFENRIVLPSWLQVAGRMHPMILHFPIVLILLYLGYVLLAQKRISPVTIANDIAEWLLLLSALTAVITALMGLFLSREKGYDADALLWHKWSGVAVSLLMLSWYGFRNIFAKAKSATIVAALLSFAAIIFTGHQGAGITHGQNFLLAPILPEKGEQRPLLEDALVYEDMVKPILQNKCMSCHNSKKAKGELVMESPELLLKGGKNGKLWDTTEADFGLMMKRIHLPLETKKHMPPQGKPQLSENEITIINEWIKAGSDFKLKVTDLPVNSALAKIAESQFTAIETDEYDFAAADENKVKSLNNNYRVVYSLAKNSPALGADFFSAAQFDAKSLEELLGVKEQLVSLNLDKMPVNDNELKTIGQFSQLRKLNLSFTNITGSTLHELNGLTELRQLSLSGTKINADALKSLSSLKQLSKLFIWNTGIQKDQIRFPDNKNLIVETGFRSDTIVLKLTPPVLLNEQRVIVNPIALKLRHYSKGVEIRYTLDGKAPDSLTSPVYADSIMVAGSAHLKAIAYKPGWYSSDTIEAEFIPAKYKADSLIHLLPPDNSYQDEKNKTLINLIKGDKNFRSGKWVGFHNNGMEALLEFKQPATVSRVTVSSVVDISSYLMPPLSLEVWGGDDPKQLKLLQSITPAQPAKPDTAALKKGLPSYLKVYDLGFKTITVRYLKVVAKPVAKLPKWHPGKGQPGWFFADEIMVN